MSINNSRKMVVVRLIITTLTLIFSFSVLRYDVFANSNDRRTNELSENNTYGYVPVTDINRYSSSDKNADKEIFQKKEYLNLMLKNSKAKQNKEKFDCIEFIFMNEQKQPLSNIYVTISRHHNNMGYNNDNCEVLGLANSDGKLVWLTSVVGNHQLRISDYTLA